jgi:glutathione S-transferase
MKMAKPVLVIGNKNYSSWSMRAWLALKKLGIDFDEVRIPLYTDGYKEKILEYSPAGKVPVFIEDGVTVWDTLSIMEYLAEKHPSLWPGDARLRALARSVSAEMHSGGSRRSGTRSP